MAATCLVTPRAGLTQLRYFRPSSACTVSWQTRLKRVTARQQAQWKKRALPESIFHSSRFATPWRKSSPSTFPWSISTGPRCILGVRTQPHLPLTYLVKQRRAWVVSLQGPGQLALLTPSSLCRAPLSIPSSVDTWYAALLRGLGGFRVLKLRFKGKSFKWHRRRASLMLRFGHSHLVYIRAWPGVRWKKRGKMKILLFGSSYSDLQLYGITVVKWRHMNTYHGRGLRFARQFVYRKAGKVSAYR